jgi:hypothetical protein
MYAVIRNFSIAIIVLAGLCGVTTASAQALTENGYVTPQAPSQAQVGVGTELSTPLVCTGGAPSVTFYASTTANTAGSAVGSYTLNNETGYVWYPTADGTLYISAYVTLNGASCTLNADLGQYESSTPITTLVSVIG